MSYTATTKLSLAKAVPGSNQPFETTSINSNWDKVDAEAVAIDVRLDAHDADVVDLKAGNTIVKIDGGTA